jgi:hypothetical protein
MLVLPTDGANKQIGKLESLFTSLIVKWPCGATVARLTPDQKAACSNHVGVSNQTYFSSAMQINMLPNTLLVQ